MGNDTVYFKSALLLLVGLLLVSCARSGKPVSTGELLHMKGKYSVRAPDGNNWMLETNKVQGELRFDRSRDGGKSTFIVIGPGYAEPSSSSQSEEQAAASIFATEKRVMNVRGWKKSYFLEDISRENTIIGRKKLYVMKYTITDLSRVPMEIQYAMYLYFPNYAERPKSYYIFLVGDVLKIDATSYVTDLSVVNKVIDSFKTK